MAIQLLYSDNLDPDSGSLTARFSGATGFYIDAPTLGAELEIDVFLQVYLVDGEGETPRNLALGKLKDGEIKLNETDTETVTPIPDEFLDTGMEMALFFLPSEVVALDVWLVVPDCNLCTIDTGLSALSTTINNRFDDIEAQLTAHSNSVDARFVMVNQTLAAMQATLAQILAAVTVDVITPGAVPTQAEQDFFFLN